jgi:hypothetical protein
MPTAVDVKVLLMYIVNAIEFTLVCFWTEFRQFIVRQKYLSLDTFHELFLGMFFQY